MKRKIIVAVAAITLITAGFTEAGVSLIMNGSFENDGSIPNITTKSPRYWCDVVVPSGKFFGWVQTDWSTHGDRSLTFYSGFGTFSIGEAATASQEVFLADVEQIIFDVKLVTTEGQPWPAGKRSAILLLDGNIVWDSNTLGPSGDGEYLNVVVDVNQAYRDANVHTLTVGMKSNVNETSYFYEYLARWDFAKFDTHCGGFGYLPEDFDHDCCVDINDLGALAGEWLGAEPNEEYDLFADGAVNFQDYAYFAECWQCTSRWQNWQDSNFVEAELPVSDMDNSGRVDYGDILLMGSTWLDTGDCLGADLNRDKKVDSKDFTILNSQWGEKSWLFYVAE